ncbi:MAG: response regulator [Pseudomonadota bacterium]
MKTFTTGEAAKLCNVNFRTVSRWVDRGYLEAYSLPGRGDRRITKEALITFMHKNGMPIPKALQQSQRVLVIDDEPGILKAIQRLLRREQYEVEIASSGFEAGVKLQVFSPAVITLDLRMPGMNGFEVLQYIRENYPDNAPKILVVSAEVQSNLDKAIAMGADDVLQKPFTNEILVNKVKQLMSS